MLGDEAAGGVVVAVAAEAGGGEFLDHEGRIGGFCFGVMVGLMRN